MSGIGQCIAAAARGMIAPRWRIFSAASACAACAAATGASPLSRAARYAALNESPAAVVSTGSTTCGTGTYSRPDLSAISALSEPF